VNIDCVQLWYMNTGAGPFEDWAEDWFHEDDVQLSHSLETDFGGGWTLDVLVCLCKKLTLTIRQGKTEKIDRQLYLIK
jgi:hypothetical protein